MANRVTLPELFEPGDGRFLGYFLKVVAVLYLLGALVHLGNLTGFNEIQPKEAPLIWLVLDVFYLVLDLLVGIGLWQRTSWGVKCFLIAVMTQLVLYTGFPSYFAKTPGQVEALRGLVGFHLSTVAMYVVLRVINR